MDPDTKFLITLCDGMNTIRVAVNFKYGVLSDECKEYYMEQEHRTMIHGLLPEHIKSYGNIVQIEDLWDVITVS